MRQRIGVGEVRHLEVKRLRTQQAQEKKFKRVTTKMNISDIGTTMQVLKLMSMMSIVLNAGVSGLSTGSTEFRENYAYYEYYGSERTKPDLGQACAGPADEPAWTWRTHVLAGIIATILWETARRHINYEKNEYVWEKEAPEADSELGRTTEWHAPDARRDAASSDQGPRREACVQAPCTYKWWLSEPRFVPLPAQAHGLCSSSGVK